MKATFWLLFLDWIEIYIKYLLQQFTWDIGPTFLGIQWFNQWVYKGLFFFCSFFFLRHRMDRANVMYLDFIACWISLNVKIFLSWPIDIASLVNLTALTFLPDFFKVWSHISGWITQMINSFLLNTFTIFYCEKSTMTLPMTLALPERISGKYKEGKNVSSAFNCGYALWSMCLFAALMDFGCWSFFKSFCERGVLFLPVLHIWNIWGL